MVDNGELYRRLLNASSEVVIPEYTYIDLDPRFASLVFTIPNLHVPLPENETLQPQHKGVTIKILNNGRLKVKPYDTTRLEGLDYDKKPTIVTAEWKGNIYTGEQLLQMRPELLQQFFVSMLGNEETVEEITKTNESKGLEKGSYLYRAIRDSEWRNLQKVGYKDVSYLDPSANFEDEQMFQGTHSQAKMYVNQKDEGYSGHILRWQIEHPLLYRKAGMNPQRVVPMFSHYLPALMEVSDNTGVSFNAIQSPKISE